MAAYTTLAEVKVFGSITDGNKDAKITALIPLIQAAMDTYTGRFFDKQTITINTHPKRLRDTSRLSLPFYPIVTLTSVTEDTTVSTNGTDFEALLLGFG